MFTETKAYLRGQFILPPHIWQFTQKFLYLYFRSLISASNKILPWFSCDIDVSYPLVDCVPTYYGDQCNISCSDNCQNKLCNQTTGHCFYCIASRSGVFCENEIPINQAAGMPYHYYFCYFFHVFFLSNTLLLRS